MITVVGLGVDEGDITLKGREAILSAGKVLVRTAHTRSYASVVSLGVEHETLDSVYEKSRNFTTLHKNLAKAVRDAERKYGSVAYCVDGSAIEDNSVRLLKRNTSFAIVDGVSKVSAVVSAAGLAGCSYSAVSAYDAEEKYKNGGLVAPMVVFDVDDSSLAGDLKILLSDCFGEETTVKFVQGGRAKKVKLYEIDRMKRYDYTTAIVVEEQELTEKKRFTLADLQNIIVRLRRPDGCPWDKVQTPESIKMNAVEEAYELLDAIDSGAPEKILEEAGDMLMQVVFHAVMQEERGEFSLSDVVSGVCDKLIFRHTHVFGKDEATDEKDALSVWEKNKMTEKGQVTFSDSVNDVPKAFPAVMRAQKVCKRAGKAGMDFASTEAAAERLKEELQEFFNAQTHEEREKELGDLLFAAVNVGRKAGCDCEKALKESVDRFAARFTLAEKNALADGKRVTEFSETEWDEYYKEAKKELQ